MSHLDLTREWLGNVLRPYPSRDRILNEVMKVLGVRRTLSVKTDAFTFNSGQTALLLLLHGTLPINYRGATYHIPVHVWIPHEYPRAPPMPFVVPTKEMGVRKGREVDPSGRVKEEVVEEWWRSWQTKDIDTLLNQLTSVFSAAPPVYAKPPEAAASPAQSSRTPVPAQTPVPGPAFAQGGPSAFPGASYTPPRPAGPGQPPMPPARPYMPGIQTESLPQYRSAPTPTQTYGPAQGQSHSRQSSASYPTQMPGTPPRHPGSPVVPPRPATGSPYVPQRPYVPTQTQNGFGPAQGQQQMPLGYDGAPPSQFQPQQYVHPQGNNPTVRSSGDGYQNHAALSPAPYDPRLQHPAQIHQQQGQYHPPPQSGPQRPVPGTPPVRPPVQDLLSSPEAEMQSLPSTHQINGPPPAPPSKPPPPSLLHLHSILLPHLQASLPPLLSHLQSTRAHLLDRREDLVSGEPAIRDEMARLEAVKKVCDSTGRKLSEVVRAGDERIAELEARGETSVDELVCGISIVHNQLIDLVAEDNAIEDTIYHMTRAFDAERIDLDRYLKSIRSLAREQYMKRALIERILHGMGQKQTW
ncbi:hypothetical protein IAU60_002972 [Kwoniella sp. DSM 27419]